MRANAARQWWSPCFRVMVVALAIGLVGSLFPVTEVQAAKVSKCQRTLARAGGKYVRLRYQAIARCRDSVRAAALPQGTECTSEPATKAALDKAERGLRKSVSRRCKQVTAAELGYPTAQCPDVIEPADIVTCLIGAYGDAVDTFVPGAPPPTTTTTSTSSTTTTSTLPPPAFQAGDTIPGFVLKGPTGSKADIRARGSWDADTGTWAVILTRALTTPFPEEDRQFDFGDPANVYWFGAAILDNAKGTMGTMADQDPGPYTIGNENSVQPAGSLGHLMAQPESPADAGGFTGNSVTTAPTPPTPAVTLQAAYDGRNIYILAVWTDDDEDNAKQHWVFDGAVWNQTEASTVQGGEPGRFDEDRFSILWDINAQDFATEGCQALCHNDRMRSNNVDGRADFWHWKAARTNPLRYADDQRLDSDPSKCPITPCRKDDTGTGIDSANKDATGTAPAFMSEDDPGDNAPFLIDTASGASRSEPFMP